MLRGIDALFVVAALVSGAFASSPKSGESMETIDFPNVCKTGSMQSPINFHPCHSKITDGANSGETMNVPNERPKLGLSYGADKAELKNHCHDHEGHSVCSLEVIPKSDVEISNLLTVPGDEAHTYSLTKCIFRMESEHTVNHMKYPLEVQCHHDMDHAPLKRKAILSTFYEVGYNAEGKETHSDWIASLEDKLPPSATGTSTIDKFHFSPTGTAGLSRYFSYKGSHTDEHHGSCEENVDWFVMYDPTGISKKQLDKLKKNITHHTPPRPMQDLYGRHPEGCHHAKKAGAAPIALGLSLGLVVLSVFGRN